MDHSSMPVVDEWVEWVGMAQDGRPWVQWYALHDATGHSWPDALPPPV